jgi:hypothetical protein
MLALVSTAMPKFHKIKAIHSVPSKDLGRLKLHLIQTILLKE